MTLAQCKSAVLAALRAEGLSDAQIKRLSPVIARFAAASVNLDRVTRKHTPVPDFLSDLLRPGR